MEAGFAGRPVDSRQRGRSGTLSATRPAGVPLAADRLATGRVSEIGRVVFPVATLSSV